MTHLIHAFWASIGWHAGTWVFRSFGVVAIAVAAFVLARSAVRGVARLFRTGGQR